MKSLITVIVFFVTIVLSSNLIAQYYPCSPDPSFIEAGLYPSYEDLDCFDRGDTIYRDIQFKNFADVSGITIDSIRIDSITNLPCCTDYYLSEEDKTYGSGEAGCIEFLGLVDDSVGQYKLGIYITLWASVAPNGISGEVNTLARQFAAGDFSYYVRVRGDSCTAVDTSSAANNITASCETMDNTGMNQDWTSDGPLPATRCLPTAIVEEAIAERLRLYPNPVNNTLHLSLTGTEQSTFQLSLVNVLGEVVLHDQLMITPGVNAHSFDVSELPGGVYICTVTDGKVTYSQRLVVE